MIDILIIPTLLLVIFLGYRIWDLNFKKYNVEYLVDQSLLDLRSLPPESKNALEEMRSDGGATKRKFEDMVLLPSFGVSSGKGKRRSSKQKTIRAIRPIRDFKEIEVSGSIRLKHSSENAACLSITAEADIIEQIITEVKDGVLLVYSEGCITTTEPIIVECASKSLTKAELKGSGVIVIDGLKTESLNLAITGSGKISVRGDVSELSVNSNGAGDIDCSKVHGKQAVLDLIGSGTITAHVIKSANAHLKGAGRINIIGGPQQVSQSVTGSGIITIGK